MYNMTIYMQDNMGTNTAKYLKLSNAMDNAKLVSECVDVESVDVIDCETGEVMGIFKNGNVTYISAASYI